MLKFIPLNFTMFTHKCYICAFTIFIVFQPVLGQTLGGRSSAKCESNRKKFLVSVIDTNTITCPPIFGDDDDKFCCSRGDGSMYCCDASEFIEQTGIGFVMPILVSLFVALCVVCCVCCLCCPCCLWYKRRHRGTVYNNVPPVSVAMQQPAVPPHGPNSDVYQQQPPPYPVMPSAMPYPQMPQGSNIYPPVPPHGMSSQQQYPPSMPYPPAQQHYSQMPPPPAVPPHGQLPPPYEVTTNQMYAKQSAYNPNF